MCEEKLLGEIVDRLGAEVKGLFAKVCEGRVSAATVETVVRERLWHFGAQLTGVLLQVVDGRLTAERAIHDRRTRTVLTLFGPVDVTRSRLPDGTYPLDDDLGLVGRHAATASVQEAVSLVSCECSFEATGDLLRRLLGLEIHGPSVKVLAQEAGRRAGPLVAEAPAAADSAAGKTLILATDGCQAPERDGWHEVKVATLYAKEKRCRTAGGRAKVVSKEYLASLSDAEGFGRELWQRASRWGVERAGRVVVMGDGAPWIWNLAAEHYPGATEIVDYYHAVEHLWTAAEAVWGDRERSEATRGWVRHYRRRLKEGRVDLVIDALARAPTGRTLSASSAAVVSRNVGYFRTNRERMRYDRYRRDGLPIGTGMVEGSCKYVVQSRFKRPGSRWSRDGLARMLSLKLMRLNHHWERLWPHLMAA